MVILDLKDELEKYGFGACKNENCGLKISEDNQNDKFERKCIKDYSEEVLEIKKVVQEYENKYSKNPHCFGRWNYNKR